MKKLLLRFSSVFLAVIVLMSCLAVPVSADFTSELLTEFDSPSLTIKSMFLEDDKYVYDDCILYRYSDEQYMFIAFNSETTYNSDISYIDVTSTNTSYLMNSSSEKETVNKFVAIRFVVNTNTGERYWQGVGTKENVNYFAFLARSSHYSSYSDSIQGFADNVIYSSYDIKYNDLTIYTTSENQSFSITDLISYEAEIIGPSQVSPIEGDYDFIGPLPLIREEGNATFEGFKVWLIENEKYKELTQFGINCSIDNLRNLVDFWTGGYTSINEFLNALKTIWSSFNAVSQAQKVWNWLQTQWDLYKESLVTWATYPINNEWTEIETDEDGNFISSEIQYLKMILGVLMTVPQNTANFVYQNLNSTLSTISNNVYSIASYLEQLPQNVADKIYNNFVEPINLILEAIQSNGVSSESVTNNYYTYNTEVGEAEREEFNLLITQYNKDYEELIKSKFPFINQVTGIFDEVWSACGYSETTVTVSEPLTTSYSTGPQQTQQDFINSQFSKMFPTYDSSYLDSVSASNAPKLSMNIAGNEVNIVDFRIFEKYRNSIHAVITLVFWIPYLLSLYKSIPSILSGVSDIYNIYMGDIIDSVNHENYIMETEAIIEANQVTDLNDFRVFEYNPKDDTYTGYR